jgi:hypothetical protein
MGLWVLMMNPKITGAPTIRITVMRVMWVKI